MLINDVPLKEFHMLDECLSQYGVPFTASKGDVIISDDDNVQRNVVVIKKGYFSVSIKNSDLMLGIMSAPLVFGIVSAFREQEIHYHLTAENHCSGYYIPEDKMIELITLHELWREAFHWVIWQCGFYQRRDLQINGCGSYKKICAQLHTMMQWECTIRSQIGVINYIHRCTHLSRSVIASVLAALRDGDYIEMNKGKLIAIKKLPKEY